MIQAMLFNSMETAQPTPFARKGKLLVFAH